MKRWKIGDKVWVHSSQFAWESKPYKWLMGTVREFRRDTINKKYINTMVEMHTGNQEKIGQLIHCWGGELKRRAE